MALNFKQFEIEANEFMKDYNHELNLGGDMEKAGRILSAILHGLRELISFEESLQLLAQLPMFMKAVYVNGWSSHKKNKIKTMNEFIDLIRKYDAPTAMHDFETYELSEKYITATFMLLRRYVSLGELDDIRSELPKDLKYMLYPNIMA